MMGCCPRIQGGEGENVRAWSYAFLNSARIVNSELYLAPFYFRQGVVDLCCALSVPMLMFPLQPHSFPVLSLLLISCVTMGKSFDLFEPQFPIRKVVPMIVPALRPSVRMKRNSVHRVF